MVPIWKKQLAILKIFIDILSLIRVHRKKRKHCRKGAFQNLVPGLREYEEEVYHNFLQVLSRSVLLSCRMLHSSCSGMNTPLMWSCTTVAPTATFPPSDSVSSLYHIAILLFTAHYATMSTAKGFQAIWNLFFQFNDHIGL